MLGSPRTQQAGHVITPEVVETMKRTFAKGNSLYRHTVWSNGDQQSNVLLFGGIYNISILTYIIQSTNTPRSLDPVQDPSLTQAVRQMYTPLLYKPWAVFTCSHRAAHNSHGLQKKAQDVFRSHRTYSMFSVRIKNSWWIRGVHSTFN